MEIILNKRKDRKRAPRRTDKKRKGRGERITYPPGATPKNLLPNPVTLGEVTVPVREIVALN